jgi:FAD/FMN-containing dehydrogenase
MMKLSLLSLSLVGYAQASASIYDSLLHCLSTSGVPQVYPNTTDFAQTIVPYNVRLNFTPVAYTFSTTVPQVQSAVSCASNLSVKINPKSGGHSYASHSIGGEDGHLVIDLKYLYDVKVDPNTFIATIGPAARLGNIAIALFNQSGRALAHGLCPG